MEKKIISGFSKLSKTKKILWIVENFFRDPEAVMHELKSYWHKDEGHQKILDGISENTLTNFHLPYGVAPNFMINGKPYAVPMVIEESSVVAAASSAAKFWLTRGGFKAEIFGMKKLGHVHFSWSGEKDKLLAVFEEFKKFGLKNSSPITANMTKRGGGVSGIELIDNTNLEKDYYQLKVTFETCDSMGANFINSVLESLAQSLKEFVRTRSEFSEKEKNVSIIMAILSNYTPESLVRASVECKIEKLGEFGGMDAFSFAKRFEKAVKIAHLDPYRATTHNKGIFNGIDAVVIATSNDFRAIEACGHTYAARDGQYKSLSYCKIENGMFKFWLDLPLSVGTVGGLTNLHPIAKRSLELLGNPSAKELMMIIASTGLAQNFSAIKSLVTSGIQKGHMKLHLLNILKQLKATDKEVKKAVLHFNDKVVSFNSVREFLGKN